MNNDTQTLTLTDFLLARIAEDEEVAREAERVGVHFLDVDPYFGARADDDARSEWCDRINPARVLAECRVKRRIVAEWRLILMDDDPRRRMSVGPLLSAAAAAYADHPDYREEWRP